MSENGNIWVATKRKLTIFGNPDISRLETIIHSKFAGGYPVVLTSARTGLYLLLSSFYEKPDILLFPYASQCVVKAGVLAEKIVVTPLKSEGREIIYNQWGLFQKTDPETLVFLEDSADSFYPEGGIVCKNNSRFEVWSLPKSLGVSFGAIVWCKQSSDAKRLRELRDEKPSQRLAHELIFGKMKTYNPLMYSIWENYEFSHPRLNSFQVRTLSKQIELWNLKYEKRKELFITNYMKLCSKSYSQAETYIKSNFGIIPTVVEYEGEDEIEGVRHLHRILPNGGTKIVKVFAYQANLTC
jgi:putative PLP-dependent aminotransferase (TIGR04422 family)